MSTPNKAGHYFGRSSKEHEWYDLIIYVVGEAPMLRIEHVYCRLQDKLLSANPEDVCFGPELEIPEVPKSDIEGVAAV